MKRYYSFFIPLLFIYNNVICQIKGNVRDKVDNPIKNALIIAIDSAMNLADSVRSDSTGYFSFSTLKPGKYLIQVKAAGFPEQQYKNVVARKVTDKPETENDVTNATWLSIDLYPAKNQKQ